MYEAKDPFECPHAYYIAGQAFKAIAGDLERCGHKLEQAIFQIQPDGNLGVFFKTDKHPKEEPWHTQK